jgi:hypothetical protein
VSSYFGLKFTEKTDYETSHMGITVVEPERGDLDKVVNAIKEAVSEAVDAKNGKL